MRLKYFPQHFPYDYLKGIVITDGHISKRNGVRLSTAYVPYAELYRLRGYSVTKESVSDWGIKPRYSVRIGNLPFAENHLCMGVGKRYTDLQLVNDGLFLAGVIDGDGYVSKSRAEVSLAIHDDRLDFMDTLLSLYAKHGIQYGIYKPKTKKVHRVYVKNIPAVTKLAHLTAGLLMIDYKSERLSRFLQEEEKGVL